MSLQIETSSGAWVGRPYQPFSFTVQSLEHVLGIPLNLGSVQKVWEAVSAAAADPDERLELRLPQEPVMKQR